jgi:hypothetical protein
MSMVDISSADHVASIIIIMSVVTVITTVSYDIFVSFVMLEPHV